MAGNRQLDFYSKLGTRKTQSTSFGGSQWSKRKKRKERRPLSPHKPVHLVMKASVAKGALNMRRPATATRVWSIIQREAKRRHVKIERYVNVGNHLHFKLRFAETKGFQAFLRTISCLIARTVTGAKKGKPFGRKFWDFLAFTRVITSFKEERGIDRYLEANTLEAEVGKFAREWFEAGYG